MKLKRADDAGPGAICWRIVFTLNNKEYALHVDNNTVTALEVGYESRFLPYIFLLGIRDEQKCWSTEKQAHENDRNPSLLVADHKTEFTEIPYSCALRYDICQSVKVNKSIF